MKIEKIVLSQGRTGLLDKMTAYVPHKTIFQMKADDL